MSTVARRIRAAMAPAAKTLLLRSGALRALRSMRPSQHVAILRYHAICGPEGHAYATPEICISPAAFDDHVRHLTSEYRVLPLGDVVEAFRAGKALPPNAVVITFDDGYADNFAAAETLRRYRTSGTFYLTAGCLDGGQPFWPSELRYLVSGIPELSVTLHSAGEAITLALGSHEDRQSSIRRLSRLFKSRPIAERERLREELRHAAGTVTMPRIMLTVDQVRDMHRMGMTIGAHTVTHPNLPSAGLTEAREEIRASRARLEEAIDAPVTMFSYPNGGAERYYTPELQRAVSEAGYASAATSRNGFADASSDLFALERIEVSERLPDLAFSLEVERFAFAQQ
jgi:peptidoglycan/xylan/chitin deacetylase (PgdA/CDA1 family)